MPGFGSVPEPLTQRGQQWPALLLPQPALPASVWYERKQNGDIPLGQDDGGVRRLGRDCCRLMFKIFMYIQRNDVNDLMVHLLRHGLSKRWLYRPLKINGNTEVASTWCSAISHKTTQRESPVQKVCRKGEWISLKQHILTTAIDRDARGAPQASNRFVYVHVPPSRLLSQVFAI